MLDELKDIVFSLLVV